MQQDPGKGGIGFWRDHPPIPTAVALAIVYLALHFALDLHAHSFITSLRITPWYPPMGFALGALLICGRWLYPVVTGAFFLGSLFVWQSDSVVPVIILSPLIKAAAATIGAELLRDRRRLLGPRWALNEVGAFLAVATLVAFFSGTANFGLWALFGVPLQGDYVPHLIIWILGDLLGLTIVAPVLLVTVAPAVVALKRRSPRAILRGILPVVRIRPAQAIELMLFLALTLAIIYLAFLSRAAISHTLYFLCFLPVLWAVLRFGFAGAVLTVAAIDIAALILTLYGAHPRLTAMRHGDLEVFQLFIIVLALIGYVLGAAIDSLNAVRRALAKQTSMLEDTVLERTRALAVENEERRRAEAELKRANELLEQRVEERTRALVMEKIRAEEANRAKTRFLQNMSHELRTPLNAIVGFAEIIERQLLGHLGNPRYRDYASDIAASGRHLAELVSDLLDIASLEAGDSPLHLEPTPLAGVIEDALRMAEIRAAEKGCRIEFGATEEEAFLVLGDHRRLVQIMLNLLSNAIRFSPPGESVRIGVRRHGREIEVSIADHGQGIAPEDVPHLFERFWRSRASLVSSDEGIGLGLAIVKMLVEQHGGRITVESRPGTGTTIRVFLPMAAGADATREDAEEAKEAAARPKPPK